LIRFAPQVKMLSVLSWIRFVANAIRSGYFGHWVYTVQCTLDIHLPPCISRGYYRVCPLFFIINSHLL